MRSRPVAIGSTLSQVGLAMRIERSTSWVRRKGHSVTGFVRASHDREAGHYETWDRMEWSDGRCAGYRRVS